LEKKAFQVDVRVSVRCAVLAENENEAKQKVQQELGRLLTPSGGGFSIDVVEIKPTEVR
jgi:hypothetical protein